MLIFMLIKVIVMVYEWRCRGLSYFVGYKRLKMVVLGIIINFDVLFIEVF